MKNVNNKKIISLFDLSRILSDKYPNSTTVFLTGVFDIPHVGHTDYLNSAAQLGDIFIVGLHSDDLVKLRKGESRPDYPIEERIRIMSSNQDVDYIVELEDQESIYEAIRKLRPDILVVSTSTEDNDNCPQTMKALFNGYVRSIVIFEPFSKKHSTDYIHKGKEELV